MKIEDRINQLEEKKQEIISFMEKLDERLIIGEIDPVEYQVMIDEKFSGKTKEEHMKDIQNEGKGTDQEVKIELGKHNILAKGVTLFQIAIAIAAVSALTRKKWLWYGSLIISVGGLMFFILGLI